MIVARVPAQHHHQPFSIITQSHTSWPYSKVLQRLASECYEARREDFKASLKNYFVGDGSEFVVLDETSKNERTYAWHYECTQWITCKAYRYFCSRRPLLSMCCHDNRWIPCFPCRRWFIWFTRVLWFCCRRCGKSLFSISIQLSATFFVRCKMYITIYREWFYSESRDRLPTDVDHHQPQWCGTPALHPHWSLPHHL